MKRVVDISVCLLLSPLALPLLLLCALAVRLTSKGPVIYKQWRLGFRGDPVRLWKLRTMVIDSPDWHNPDGPPKSAHPKEDFTPVGRWLRATYFEDLPLLWNVLKGDMSLVGPRAEMVDQRLLYTDRDRMRLRVPPGITGLAQIRGRNAITWEERRLLDVEYVKRHTLWMDLRILWKTIPCLLSGKGLHTADPPVAPRIQM